MAKQAATKKATAKKAATKKAEVKKPVEISEEVTTALPAKRTPREKDIEKEAKKAGMDALTYQHHVNYQNYEKQRQETIEAAKEELEEEG